MKAFYFSTNDRRLRYDDGREVAEGVTHTVEGLPKLCEHGLHASKRPSQALAYAKGDWIWLVELSGDMDIGDDKIAAQTRTYIKGLQIEELLRKFARSEALRVAHLWDCPDIVRTYLETGDEDIRAAAWAAARAAAMDAAMDAAMAAAGAAAWAAAWAAARAGARAAAWDAAMDAEKESYMQRFDMLVYAEFKKHGLSIEDIT